MATLNREGDVFLLNLGDDENRFTQAWVQEVSAALDEVAGADGPRALVTVATGKFWSNGLDLDWMLANRDQTLPYIKSVQHLFVQLLTLPAYSIAAIQGHCFAAGALLALAQDTRIMRADRGFFCLPEVDLGIPFTPGMSGLIQGKLSADTALETMITGRRYGGDDARAAGIVSQSLSEDELLPAAMALASELAGKAGATMKTIRSEMFHSTIESLESEAGLRLPG